VRYLLLWLPNSAQTRSSNLLATDPDFRKQLPAGIGKAGMQPMSFLIYQIATIRLRQAAL
jgi:hypothetical protein